MNEGLYITETIKSDIISYLDGKMTEEQTQRLWSWVNEDINHKRFFDEITDVWRSASPLKNEEFDSQKAWNEVVTQITGKSSVPEQINRRKLWSGNWFKVAAVFLVAFLLGGGSVLLIRKTPGLPYANRFIVMEAPLGSKSYVTLPDGTKVWLNAGTKLKYQSNYGATTREVVLDGEAYFTVAKDKTKPFIVKTSDVNIRALGTSFNVKAYANENTIETTLEEGAVRIDAISAKLNGKTSDPLILKPNEKAVFSKIKRELAVNTPTVEKQATKIEKPPIKEEVKALEVIAVPDVRVSTSWKDTRWVIRHETLGDLAVKLERRYAVNVAFADEQIKEYVFNGTLLDESLEQVLEVIGIAAPIAYDISHKNVTLKWNKQFKDKYQNLLLQQNK